MDRPESLLFGIDQSCKVLELGPSIFPRAPRSAGWDVTVVDHATQEELIAKYRNEPNVDVTKIEPVDHVWRGGPLHEAVPSNLHGTFDVLIASHVIEHIPNPIGFFQSAERLLHPVRGILSLGVPDKRWCFDYFKQVSTTGQMLEANRTSAQRHSAATRFDQSAYVATDGDRIGWSREPLPNLRLSIPMEHAYGEFQAWTPDPHAPYVDCHAWHFTPASFRLLVLELGVLGLIDWNIAWLTAMPGVEFLTHMRRGRQTFATAAEREARRLELLKQMLLDIREQTDFLLSPITDRRSAPVAVPAPAGAPVVDSAPPGNASGEMLALLHEIAETTRATQDTLRPMEVAWRGMLPIRRQIARLRGRV